MSESKGSPPMTTTFKPSDIRLALPVPLCGTMGKAEAEFAATLLVRACVRHGDAFDSILPAQMGDTIGADLEEQVDPLWSLRNNPFFRPNFDELVKRGFAEYVGEDGGRKRPLRFTASGLEVLRRWVAA